MNIVMQRLKQRVSAVIQHRHVRRTAMVFHWAMAGFAGVSLISIFVQVFYPIDRALPLNKVDTIPVGVLTADEIKTKLEKMAAHADVNITTPTKQYKVKWASIGVTIDRTATAEAAVRYDLWERFIPFSSLVRSARASNISPIVIVDKERLKTFVQKVVAENKRVAEEAKISIEQGVVKLQPGKAGYEFTADDIERQLQATPFHAGERVELQARFVPTRISHDELMAAKLRAEAIIDRDITIKIGEKTFQPDKVTRGEWLHVAQDDISHTIVVQLKAEKLESYINEISSQVATPPGVTHVTLLDGQEISKVEGVSGRNVNQTAARTAVEKALFEPNAARDVMLTLETQSPRVAYTKTYSRGDEGLQALIRDWETETYGTYGIIVREIGGQQRYADFQPDRLFVTASTFKMFVAYDIFIKMQRGEVTDGTVLDNGWTVQACMDEMILHSTNPCAISFQNWLGWQASEDMVREAGFTSTFLNNQGGGDKHSTVRDETNFMLRLNAGTLLNRENTERLLSLFKRQVWRGGIPSGVPRGTVVANKVGFYNGYIHDVGIIYAPKTTYILGIMSRGGSDPVFADLSRRVYNFFNR